jgi:predicted phosphodiesterase
MKILVLADVHANLTAFEAVLADAGKRGKPDEVWCLGDVVGYGPDPCECIALAKKTFKVCVAGNHDWAACGRRPPDDFNENAAAAAAWTTAQLKPDEKEYLRDLLSATEREDVLLAHGSPREPLREYLVDVESARENLPEFSTMYCFVGHSHVPLAFKFDDKGQGELVQLRDGMDLDLNEGFQILNPGAVGQPRDRDPRASYAIYDTDRRTFGLHRVLYDVRSVQARMRDHGLPSFLVARLGYGM